MTSLICGLAIAMSCVATALAQTRSGVVTVAGASLPYEMTGRGPALVFIHGYTQNMSIWDEQVPVFSPRFTVIRYDVRGFGRSTGDVDRTINAADLAALLDSLRVDRASVVGLSMGSGIALNFAILFPKRVDRLVLYGASPTPDFPIPPPQDLADLFATLPKLARTYGIDSVWSALGRSEIAWMPPNRPDIAPKRAKAQQGYSARDLTDPKPPSNHDAPVRLDQINGVRVPTLVIHGDRELAWFRQFDDTLMARLPNAKRVVIKSGGHGAHFAQPDAFNRAVLDFLTGRSASLVPELR